MKRLCLLLLVACGHDPTPRPGSTPEAGLADASMTTDAGPTGGGAGPASDPGFVGCGPTSCSPGGVVAQTCCVTSSVSQCQELSACSGHRLSCDETADCRGGQCCAERDGANVVTACRANCITGTPRWQVCKRDGECESGACRPYLCAPDLPPIRACAQPDGCTPQ